MFRPVPMLKLEVLVLEKHLDALTRALGRSGFVHLVPASAQSPGRLFQGVSRGDEIRQLENQFQQCRELVECLKLEIGAPLAARATTGGSEASNLKLGETNPGSLGHWVTESHLTIERVARLVDAESAELKRFAEEAARLRAADEFLAAHPALAQVPIGELRALNHLFVLAGRMPAAAFGESGNAGLQPALMGVVPGDALNRGLKHRVTSGGTQPMIPVLGEGVLVLSECAVPTSNGNRGTEDAPALTERGGHRRNGDEVCIVVVGPAKARSAAEQELARYGFKADTIPTELADSTGEAERQRLAERLVALERQAVERHARLAEIAKREGGALAEAFLVLQQELEIAKAQQQFGKSGGMFGVAGWFPAAKREAVLALAKRASGGTAVVAFTEPREDELVQAGTEKVPVKFAGNALLAPFQEMVAVYGVPRYNEIEPSLFLAVSFLLMFGLMFGDVGQGVVLVLAGMWLLRGKKAEGKRQKAEVNTEHRTSNIEHRTSNVDSRPQTPEQSESVSVRVSPCPSVPVREYPPAPRPMTGRRKAGWFLVMGGCSAMLFGFLYGSVFGYEKLLPHLWLSPLHSVATLFGVAVGLGAVYISIGVILNIVNRFADRRWFEGVFDKSGVLGLVFYWGCIGLGVKAALAGGVTVALFALVAGTPLLLLLLKEPLHALLNRRLTESTAIDSHRLISADIEKAERKNGKTEPKEDRLTMVFGAGMEVFETITGFLGNTVSFVRVGAFALSHATLCMTVYVVGGLVRDLPGGGLWWLLVVIFGNALVIALEGMIVTIQGLRLQYYEFFSRFFSGDGVAYKPFALAAEAESQIADSK